MTSTAPRPDASPAPAGWFVDGAAAYLNMTPALLRHLIREGAIRAHNVSTGRGVRPRWWIAKAELDRFAAEGPRRP